MMKKIKSIKQLQIEKKRINQQQEELENKIRRDWKELKENLKPINIAKDTISNALKNQTKKNLNGDSILKSAFAFGITLLAKRFTDKAGEKLSRIFKKQYTC